MRRFTLEQQAEAIEAMRREKGYTDYNYVLPNNGTRRTASKRALLQYIRDEAAKDGKEPPFKASF